MELHLMAAPPNRLLSPSSPYLPGLSLISCKEKERLYGASKSPQKMETSLSAQIICSQKLDLGLTRRQSLHVYFVATTTTILQGLVTQNNAGAASTSKRAFRVEKIPESDYKTLPSGLKYYDLKVGGGSAAVKGARVAVHYDAKWKGITFMTSRQGMGVTGGTPYGFDVGTSERGMVLKGLDLGVQGMRVGGQRLLIVPPELAYGNKGIQEIPPNATLQISVELLSIKQSPFGSPVKLVEG